MAQALFSSSPSNGRKKQTRQDHVWNQLLIADFASPGHDRPNGATVQIRYAINLSDLKKETVSM